MTIYFGKFKALTYVILAPTMQLTPNKSYYLHFSMSVERYTQTGRNDDFRKIRLPKSIDCR